MAYETILLEHHESVLLIKLNRPEALNAINKKMLEELCSALKTAEKDNKVRVVVIKGSTKFFAALFKIIFTTCCHRSFHESFNRSFKQNFNHSFKQN